MRPAAARARHRWQHDRRARGRVGGSARAVSTDELEEATIEERLVSASLKCVKPDERAGVEALFLTLGCFPEDAVVPAVVLDVLAPLIYARAGEASKRASGKCGSIGEAQGAPVAPELLKASLLRGASGTASRCTTSSAT